MDRKTLPKYVFVQPGKRFSFDKALAAMLYVTREYAQRYGHTMPYPVLYSAANYRFLEKTMQAVVLKYNHGIDMSIQQYTRDLLHGYWGKQTKIIFLTESQCIAMEESQ